MNFVWWVVGGGGGNWGQGGLFRTEGYGVEKQLFARCPLGKIWAGSAALENATGVGRCGKKFQKAADPPFRISNFFSLYVFPKFSVYGKIGILLYIPSVYPSHVRAWFQFYI